MDTYSYKNQCVQHLFIFKKDTTYCIIHNVQYVTKHSTPFLCSNFQVLDVVVVIVRQSTQFYCGSRGIIESGVP